MDSNAPSFTASSSVKCSHFLPGGSSHVSHWCPGKAFLAWTSCFVGPDLGLATENRDLVSASIGLRTDQKRFDLLFFNPHTLAADLTILITMGDVSNEETSPKNPSILSSCHTLLYF
jgi:hypothetical protein